MLVVIRFSKFMFAGYLMNYVECKFLSGFLEPKYKVCI
ncbi:hypothetical protein B4088_5406 [Bacillus cereus]|uniref:Uncharacterized protein n=1 Tax=Bacillus cereus TaxID=1396 RepID=A0A164LCD2_BACCE|nr:hypothetical protein B4088_5406 [Bacillus cereus]